MLAIIRPGAWNLPLFLHVLGAVILFGTTAAVAIVGFASRSRTDYAALLSRVAMRTFLFGIVPGWILMRAGAAWILSKEYPHGASTPGWVNVGIVVSEGGGVVLLVMGILAWIWRRRGGTGGLGLVVPILASICLAGFAVAWFAMSGKP
jgi:uncharacterized membrane protein